MTNTADIRELAFRRDGGIEVSLRWHPETDAVSIEVVDDKTGDRFEQEVPRGEAMDAFAHPFAYRAAA